MLPHEETEIVPSGDQKTLEWIAVLSAAQLDYRLSHVAGQWTIHIPAADTDVARTELAAYDADLSATVRVPVEGPALLIPGAYSWSPLWVAGMLVAFYVWIGPYEDGSALVRGAAMDTNLFFAGEWWRLLTALTAHADLNHLVGNVVSLLFFGYAVCQTFGGGLSWLMILGSGIAGNAAAGWLHGPDHISVGASTACFGALGILCGAQFRRKLQEHGVSRSIWSRTWIPLGAGLALLTLMGVGPRSDLMAHLFGFGSGFLLCLPFARQAPLNLSAGAQQAFQICALAILMTAWRLVLVVAGLA
jgi:rhomboid protease GluP